MSVDVSGVVEALGDAGEAAAAVGIAVLLVVVLLRSYDYIHLLLIEREANREFLETYDRFSIRPGGDGDGARRDPTKRRRSE